MRNTVIGLASVAVIGFALTGCGEQGAPDFAETAAMSDLYEIEAGRIATEKGQSDAVRAFGEKMVEDHSQTTSQLKQIVTAENIDVELPTELDSSHQDMIDELNEAEPDEFDEEYASQQVDAHQAAVDVFEDYADDGDNGALKDFAGKTLPTLQQHLEEAKQLSEQADKAEDRADDAGAADTMDATDDTPADDDAARITDDGMTGDDAGTTPDTNEGIIDGTTETPRTPAEQ